MKTTLKSIATALIMITSLSSFATKKTNPLQNMEPERVIKTYINAITLGDVQLNKLLFTDDFEYRNVSNNDRFNKKDYTDFLKANQGNKLDCETSHEILDQNGKVCIGKATTKFAKFTRVDYITLCQTEDGWQIRKVETTYP